MSTKIDRFLDRQAVINGLLLRAVKLGLSIIPQPKVRDHFASLIEESEIALNAIDEKYNTLAEHEGSKSTENMGRPKRVLYLFEYCDAPPKEITYEQAAAKAGKKEKSFRTTFSNAGGSQMFWRLGKRFVISRENTKASVDHALRAEYRKTEIPDDIFVLPPQPKVFIPKPPEPQVQQPKTSKPKTKSTTL